MCIFLLYKYFLLFHTKNGDCMENNYDLVVKKHLPKEHRVYNAFIAFVVGGLIGVIANFLINFDSYILRISSNDASVFMISTLIFIACFLTAIGVFDNFVKFGKMGFIIPITGFAHSVCSAALDYKKEGLIYGIGSNIFKLAGSVILYGVISAYVFSIIRYLFALVVGG